MEAVQAQVLSHYRSELVDRIRAKGHVLSADGLLTVKLAKEFGFCYGVERAIDLAYAARKVFPDQPIYILGEIIHNPEVNDQIRNLGIQTISAKPTDEEIEHLQKKDVVIIPAFGTQVETRAKLEAKGCQLVDTTCGDVMSVWKRVKQYSREAVTSIIHGKAWHEETKATSSKLRLQMAIISSYSLWLRPITFVIICSTAATSRNSWRNLKALTRKVLILISISRLWEWRIKRPCFAAKPKRCSGV